MEGNQMTTIRCKTCGGIIAGQFELTGDFICICPVVVQEIAPNTSLNSGYAYLCPACGESEPFIGNNQGLCNKCLRFIGKLRLKSLNNSKQSDD